MHILFRVDAGGPVGLGHFYRSIALANELARQGISITFCHAPSLFWSETGIPFSRVTLSSDHEEEHMLQLMAEATCDVFYVDGIISFSKNFVDRIRQQSIPIVFYQNISDSRHLCDVYILPSIRHDDLFFANFNPDTVIYKGLEYVIFNELVYQLAPGPRKLSKTARSVGIATGGSDPRGVLLALYNLIDHQVLKDVSFTYFYGSDFMYKKKIPNSPEANVKFLPFDQHQLSGMDVIISTFGVSTYEFMYQGIPVLSLGHQEANASASQKVARQTGGIIDLGLIDDLPEIRINSVLQQIIIDLDQRAVLSRNASQAVDARGRERVVRILTSLAE